MIGVCCITFSLFFSLLYIFLNLFSCLALICKIFLILLFSLINNSLNNIFKKFILIVLFEYNKNIPSVSLINLLYISNNSSTPLYLILIDGECGTKSLPKMKNNIQ